MKERLQKVRARAGHGSRRSAETLIASGRVRVNGETVTELGTQADPDVDRIEVDGRPVTVATERVYLAMNKPFGFVTTASDPQRRKTVMDLLPPGLPPHVFPVGRLDRDTEGLLFFTNDGEFAHRMAHPRFQIEKEYVALVEGRPDDPTLRQLGSGIVIDGEETAPARAELAPAPEGFEGRPQHSWVRLTIHQGRKRQVRRMFGAVGHQVRTLVRTRIGDVEIGRLAKGKTRRLTSSEVDALRKIVGLGET
ncbi:MAG: pseudouridine synthase [Dehalococcoidia bacterium]